MSTAESTPLRWRDVLFSQLRVCFLNRRRGLAIFLALVLAQVVALAGFGVILGITIDSGADQTIVAMAPMEKLESAMGFSAAQAVSGLGVAFHIVAVFALFFPFAVWSHEQPSRRGYHWAMPVDRRSHDLARVAAGAAILLATVTALYATSVVVSLVAGKAAGLGELSPAFWLALLVGPLLPYALASILVVRCEHPAAWFWGGLGGVALTSTFSNLAGLDSVNGLVVRLATGPRGLVQAISGPIWAQWAGRSTVGGFAWFSSWAGWMAVLGIAIFLAASTRSQAN